MIDNLILDKQYEEPKEDLYDIISVSVFRLIDNYKPMQRYYEGLRKLIDITPKYLPNYYLRIYYDDSIVKPEYEQKDINDEIKEKWLPLLEYAKSKKHVQLVKYYHKDYAHGLGHVGLFGTLIRFIPLFDYEINKNLDIVFVSDIDVESDIRSGLWNNLDEMFDRFINSDSKFHFRARYCYYTKDRFYKIGKKLHTWRIIFAGTIICKIKFPQSLLENFMTCMKKDRTERIGTECEGINKFLDIEHIGFETGTRRKVIKISDFIFGIDEYFLNVDIMNYIFEHKINFSTSVYPDIYIPTYLLHRKKWKEFKNNNKMYAALMKEIMGKYYDEKKSLDDNYKKYDSIVYEKGFTKNNTDYEYIANRLKTLASRLKKEKSYERYGFTRGDIDCILAHKSFYYSIFDKYDHTEDESPYTE